LSATQRDAPVLACLRRQTGRSGARGKHSRQNAQLVRMARERGITPVTPN